ncbi:hypothetical protein U1Q18_037997 [Sarracenia purpurea var. burkii]
MRQRENRSLLRTNAGRLPVQWKISSPSKEVISDQSISSDCKENILSAFEDEGVPSLIVNPPKKGGANPQAESHKDFAKLMEKGGCVEDGYEGATWIGDKEGKDPVDTNGSEKDEEHASQVSGSRLNLSEPVVVAHLVSSGSSVDCAHSVFDVLPHPVLVDKTGEMKDSEECDEEKDTVNGFCLVVTAAEVGDASVRHKEHEVNSLMIDLSSAEECCTDSAVNVASGSASMDLQTDNMDGKPCRACKVFEEIPYPGFAEELENVRGKGVLTDPVGHFDFGRSEKANVAARNLLRP